MQMTPALLDISAEHQRQKNLKTGKWVKLVAEVGYEYVESYHKEGPVLTAISLEPAEPLAQELVYFN